MIGWAPDVFWRSTPHDLLAALDGWGESQGRAGGLSESDVGELKALLDEAMAEHAMGQ